MSTVTRIYTRFLLLFCLLFIASGLGYGQSSVCSGQAAITIAGAGTQQIIPLTTGQNIRLCYLSLGVSAAATFQLVSGTGSNCGTGQAGISGTYPNTVTWQTTPGPISGPVGGVGKAVCLVITGTVTGGGMVTWTTF